MGTGVPERIVVAGQFELLANLGRGGMGSVYLARYSGQCLVAVKLLGRPPEGISVQEINERFRRECDVLMSVRHPAIVRAYAHGLTSDGTRYLVMEYVDGITLAELRRQNGGPLSPQQAASLLLPLADALCYCHSRKIFHRDISPHNVLVSDDGTETRHAKLVDFGSSWLDDAQNLTRGIILGNLDFQPLERFQDNHGLDPEEMGETVDIYGLAAMAYFLTGGKGPAGALLTADERMGHVRIADGIDEAWSALLAWALHHDRSRRMSSMSLFRSVLQSWVADPDDTEPIEPFWQSQPNTSGPVTAPTEPVQMFASHPSGPSWVDNALHSLPPRGSSQPHATVVDPSIPSTAAIPSRTASGWIPITAAFVIAAFIGGMTTADWLDSADNGAPTQNLQPCPDGNCPQE